MRTTTLLTAARFAKAGESFAPVALPHTWNAKDGQDGGNDYWRGVGTYEIDLPDPTATTTGAASAPMRSTCPTPPTANVSTSRSRAPTTSPPSTATAGCWASTRAAFPPSAST